MWINGQPVGASGQQFSAPIVFDLTNGVDYQGKGLLAIQVVRHAPIDELGIGGILRPSFIFAGPRLGRKAPEPRPLDRTSWASEAFCACR